MRTISRRGFLRQAAVWAAGSAMIKTQAKPAPETGCLMTVTGPIPARDLGWTLTHEHVTTDFLGAERAVSPRYDRDDALRILLPELRRARALGVRALCECTPRYIGRDVLLLERLSRASGLRILTNTGYYGAVDNRYLPRHAGTESADDLAARWLAEWREGIAGTRIRPGFIKLGTGNGPLPALHEKLLRAAARVHLQSGLTVAIHTGDGTAARDELRILGEEGVAPEALVWVHAQNDSGPIQVELARRGTWISLDGYSLAPGNPERYWRQILALRTQGLWHRLLISHDDGWAVEGMSHGATLKLFGNGNPRPYRSIFTHLLPALRRAGVTRSEIVALLRTNPQRAFAIRLRPAAG